MKPVWFMAPIIALLAIVGYFFGQGTPGRVPASRLIAMVQLTEVDATTESGFKEAMARLGYREGVDLRYLSQGPAGSVDRLEGMIQAHLQRNPDLFVVSSTPATLAVKRLSEGRNIPLVFAPVNDPLAAGIVSDLRHPGGRITGVRLPTGDDLRLDWLIRIAPAAKRVFVPYHGNDNSAQVSLSQISAAAPGLGIELVTRNILPGEEISRVIAEVPDNVQAIFLPRDSRVEAQVDAFVALANQRRLVLSAPSLIQVRRGALFSYGFVHQDIGRQAARLADQIFKGIAPGDLPVEMAESSLSINLATAARLGIRIPDHILHQAEHLVRD